MCTSSLGKHAPLLAFWALLPVCAICVAAEETARPENVPPDYQEVKIELPEANYSGTPHEYWNVHLEPDSFKDRDPFYAPAGVTNVALKKPVTSSFPEPLVGELTQITDGDKSYAKKSVVELGAGSQWTQIDLEREFEIYAVLVWHFHDSKRVYFDVVVQTANDPGFKEVLATIYNNDYDNTLGLGIGEDKEYTDDYRGRLMTCEPVKARYVRLYSAGNCANEMNHYVEVEVYGK